MQVTRLIAAYNDIERQKQKPNGVPQGTMEKIPEAVAREARKAPEDLKPKVYEKVAEHNLTVTQTRELVTEINQEPEPTETTVEEKAQALIEDATDAVKQVTKEIDRLIENSVAHTPEGLVRDIYARFNGGKVTQEKLDSYAGVVFSLFYEKAKERKEIDQVFGEADRW